MTQAGASNRRRTRGNTAGLRSGLLVAIVCLGLLASCPMLAQAGAVLAGKVVDAEDKPQPGAEVTLHAGLTPPVTTTTDPSGAFQLTATTQASYSLEAETAGHLRGVLQVSQPGDSLRIIVRPAQPQMEFADKPDFTIAGITDWTAVGGHGSDAVLRTSEDLARETATQPDAETPSTPDRGQEAMLRKAVTMDPNGYDANRAMGAFYLSSHRPAEACGFLNRAAALHGNAAPDEYQAALAYQEDGDLAKARQHVEAALKTSDAAAYHRLAGELDERLGEPVSAAREEAQATKLDPAEPNYFAWGSELLLHRAVWQAEKVFARGAELHPESQRLKTGLVAALFAEARYDEAAERICAAIDLDTSNRGMYVLLGKVALASPSVPACAGSRLKRFLLLWPRDAEANFYEGSLLLKAGDRSRAAELFTAAVALQPQFAEAYLQLGILRAAQHDDAAALQAYQRAIAADPGLPEPHYRLAVLYRRTGHDDQAKTEFALHARLIQQQADAVEQERRLVKQFVVATEPTIGGNPPAN